MSLNNMSYLTGCSVELRPMTPERVDERLIRWLNDPVVVRFSEQRHREHSLESCKEYAKSFNNSPNHYWSIHVTKGGSGWVGTVTAYVDSPNGTVDIGILIGESSVWGKGVATTVYRLLIDAFFCRPEVRKVTAGTLSCNQGMLRALEKAGMVEEARRTKQIWWEGEAVDIVYFAVMRPSCQ